VICGTFSARGVILALNRPESSECLLSPARYEIGGTSRMKPSGNVERDLPVAIDTQECEINQKSPGTRRINAGQN
jgi:hypothetical protein